MFLNIMYVKKDEKNKRILEFISKYKEEFISDYYSMRAVDVCKKYSISDSFFMSLKKELELSTITSGERHKLMAEVAARKKVKEFLDEHKEEFLSDFYVLSYADIQKKYKISYNFYLHIKTFLNISRSQKDIISARIPKFCTSWKSGGKQKYIETMRAKYGVDSSLLLPGVKEKSIVANKSSEAKKKRRETMLKLYGVPTQFLINKEETSRRAAVATASKEANQKRISTCLERYGEDYYQKRTVKIKQTMMERYGVSTAFAIDPEGYAIKARETMLRLYGVESPRALSKHGQVSKTTQRFANKLKEAGLEPEFEFLILDGATHNYYDIKIGNLLIEVNPTVTHSVDASYGQLTGKFADKPVDKNYHFRRWKLAKDKGYELLSLFDWTDQRKFIDLVLSKLHASQISIGARKLVLSEVNTREASAFLAANHVLGASVGNICCVGLYSEKKELLSVMTFCNPRYTNDYDYELSRFASKSGYSIPGAASKLFKYFLSTHDGSVITYSDNNLGNGRVYSSLGFVEEGQTGPSIVWNTVDGALAIKDTSLFRRGADALLENKILNYFHVGLDRDDFIRRGGREVYAKEFELHKDEPNWWPGNADVMRHYKFLRVADCGSTKWGYFQSESKFNND